MNFARMTLEMILTVLILLVWYPLRWGIRKLKRSGH
jgi:uncharacterized protein HemY